METFTSLGKKRLRPPYIQSSAERTVFHSVTSKQCRQMQWRRWRWSREFSWLTPSPSSSVAIINNKPITERVHPSILLMIETRQLKNGASGNPHRIANNCWFRAGFGRDQFSNWFLRKEEKAAQLVSCAIDWHRHHLPAPSLLLRCLTNDQNRLWVKRCT